MTVSQPTPSLAQGISALTESEQSAFNNWAHIQASNLDQLQPVYTLTGHKEDIVALAVSPNSAYIATGSKDGEIRLWASASGEPHLALRAHSMEITGLAWSPNGDLLASSTTDRIVKLWDPQSGELLRTIEARLLDYVIELSFTPDGRHLLLAGPECLVVLRDAQSGILYKTYPQRHCQPKSHGAVYSWGVDFDASNEEVILGFSQPAAQRGSIQRWELGVIASNELVYGFNLPVRDLDLSPDGENIAIAMVGTSFIRVMDADSIYPVRDMHAHMHRVNSLRYSPDGGLLASASNDRRIGFWDAETGENLRLTPAHADAVTQLRFSPDGTFLVTTSKDDLAIVWAIEIGQ